MSPSRTLSAPSKFPLFPVLLALVLAAGWTRHADAANIIYVHGRSLSTWPPGGLLVASPGWNQITLGFNGSARLADSGIRTYVRDRIRAACTAEDCVVVCYSAGCARTLLAYNDLAAEGTVLRVLFTEALASAAGGTELASYSTNGGLRLLAKIFLTNPGPGPESIDEDLPPDNLRGPWGFIQNAATAPVYHLAGSNNICVRTKIRGLSFLASNVAQYAAGALGASGPVGWVIGAVVGALFGSIKVSLCGNSVMPGGYGDGAVPVHSAAGYADAGAHSNHADGGAKYVFRAYEQVPLFAQDHVGIFRPAVALGSVRVAVTSATATQCIDAANAGAPGDGVASIVYEDADAATASIQQIAPIALLQICGNDMFATSSDQPMYATCNGQSNGCCDSFSTGTTSGCTCGETLCTQSSFEAYSLFTGPECSGLEYSDNSGTWDGIGMVGTASASVAIASMRREDGSCVALTHATSWGGNCTEYRPTSMFYTGRRVYRPFIDHYLADPQSWNTAPGYVVSSYDNKDTDCP